MASFPRKPMHQSARFFIGQVRSLAPAFANDGPSFDCEFARHLSKVVLTTPSLTVGPRPGRASRSLRTGRPRSQQNYLPLNSGLRFSRKAFTPSSLSSLEKQSANRSTSRRKPSSKFERDASLIASFARRIAIGLFSAMRLAISIVFVSS